MTEQRLEAFTDAVIAIPLAFTHRWISIAIFVLVALIWFVPDPRIERKLKHEH